MTHEYIIIIISGFIVRKYINNKRDFKPLLHCAYSMKLNIL